MKKLIVALLVVFALNVADIILTGMGLSLGATELNPIVYAQGFQAAMLTKLGLGIIIAPIYIVTFRYCQKKFPKYVKALWILIAFLIGFYTLIVVNNLITLSKLAGG